MQITLRSLFFFAILHVLTFGTILCKIDVEREKRELSEDDLAIRNLLHSNEGFLAGEDTPVWISYRPDSNKPVNYTKLEKGMVKKAMDYRNSDEFDAFSSRPRRSVAEYRDENSRIQSFSMPDINEEIIRGREIESTNKCSIESRPKVLYPSVLVMMDYVTNWPTDKMEQQKLIMERILYALAFWNGVDLQLRHLKNPKIRLRIAGIIIGRNKEATPYLREHEGWTGLDVDSTYLPMMRHWAQLSNTNRDFSYDAYDIVATMTDATPSLGFFETIYGIASPKPPCHERFKDVAVILFPDNFAFEGIRTAVHEIAHVLGGKHGEGTGTILSTAVNSIGRKWSKQSLDEISETLNDKGWCMENAKVYHPPGKPVEAILPGKLMPASKQCQARGWVDGNVCWEYVTCDYLYCSNNRWDSPCKNSGQAIDGTTCKPGKMCLDGRCVSNMTMVVA